MDEYELSKCKTKRYHKVKKILTDIFGYETFKPKQYNIINSIISGNDVLAILPTGYGKSITFQIPALYTEKVGIVISPLISLMEDQQLALEKLQIKSCCYNSNLSLSEKNTMRNDIKANKFTLVYITPESVKKMSDFFVEINETIGISLVAIDEAHCISAYGFDFRPAYKELNFIKHILPAVPILALTATATIIVAKDIDAILGLNIDKPIRSSFNRPNLYLEVRKKIRKADTKFDDPKMVSILNILEEHKDKITIIYCITISDVDEICKSLQRYKFKCDKYHAKYENKQESHVKFMNNEITIIVATIAFGMGINKSDVGVIIHYGCPKNIEGYYQEIGRAGRNGEEAFCYIIYSERDFMIQKMFIDNIVDPAYKMRQLEMLNYIKNYLSSKTECRKKIILKYFGEVLKDNCDFCDVCCGTSYVEDTKKMVEQDINKQEYYLN
jgi:RecQ family ATP-dependent DNA helicase